MTAILLVAAMSLGADLEPIRLPAVQVVTPQPAPAPAKPGEPIKLTVGFMYVIDSDVPIHVLDSPRGRVKKVSRDGPVTVLSKLVGGNGDYEEKTFKGKYIVTIQAATSGPVELLIVPEGLKSEADVKRASLQVEAGEGPRPPPGSDEETDPLKPKPVKPAPKPTNTKADAKLVESLTVSMAGDDGDEKTYAAWRKADSPATAKEALAQLAEVYSDAAAILSIDDANLKPKTWGELISRLANLAASKKIPTLPALAKCRQAVADFVGKRDSTAVLAGDDFATIVKQFETVSASLKEAAK
jgi:hypothetical protein